MSDGGAMISRPPARRRGVPVPGSNRGGSPRPSPIVEPIGFESAPLGHDCDGTPKVVVEFVNGVHVRGRGTDTSGCDVRTADDHDATGQTSALELSADVDQIVLDLRPAERAADARHERRRCSTDARIQTLYRAIAAGVSAMVWRTMRGVPSGCHG
jgi:hypothetical protein